MSFTRATLVSVAVSVLVGCVPPMAIKGEEIPKEGRYTVLMRKTGEVRLQHVGTTVFTNAAHQFPAELDAGERLAKDVVKSLSTIPGYEFVDINAELPDLVLPRFYVNSYDGSFGMFSTDEYEAGQAALEGKLKELSEKENLRFALVLTEWGSSDKASSTNQPLIGSGVRFRSLFGSETVTAYSVFQLRLYDVATGKSNYWSKAFLKRLPNHTWIEFDQENPPGADSVEALHEHIEATISEGASNELLCVVGLLPAPLTEKSRNAFQDCRKAYGDE